MTAVETPETARSVDETRVSFSSLARHRKCPQAWVYDSVRRLTVASDRPRVRAEFGSWWHAVRAADTIRRGRALGSLVSVPEVLKTSDLSESISTAIPNLSSQTVIDLAADWWMRQDETLRALWVETTGQALPEHLEAMNERWTSAWAAETEHERPLAVELSMRVPVRSGDTVFNLDGQTDEVYLDTRRNLLVVRDHKSNSTIPAAESLDDLLDSQTHLYGWMASRTLAGKPGMPEGLSWALSYDRARTKPPSEPALTKSGSLSKSTTDYDLAAYLAFTAEPVAYPGLKKDGSGAGTYERDEAVVERLSSPAERSKWNDRTLTPVNLHLVRSHLREAVNTRAAMEGTLAQFQREGQATRNLTRMGCGWCDFQALCLAEMRAGGPSEDLELADYGLRQDSRSAL